MLKELLRRQDWIMTTITLLILVIGITTLYSNSLGSTAHDLTDNIAYQKQIIFSIAGIFIYFIFSQLDYTYFKYKPIIGIIYILNFALLILVLIHGDSQNGASRWISIGGFNIQPSETSKIVVILTLASFLSSYQNKLNTTLEKFKFYGIIFILITPLIALIFLEPSLSSSVILAIISISILFMYSNNQINFLINTMICLLSLNIGAKLFMPKILGIPIIQGYSIGLILISLILIAVPIIMKKIDLKLSMIIVLLSISIGFIGNTMYSKLLQNYQKERINAYTINNVDCKNITANTWQICQAKIAIGSGGLFGKGFGKGTQSKFDFLPEHNTDFIFASYSEEFGLFGDTILILLFGILLFRISNIAEKTKDTFGFFIIIGAITMLIFQIFINMGINMGLFPATGIPMPLMTYGGSSLWTIFIVLGIIQSIYTRSSNKVWINTIN